MDWGWWTQDWPGSVHCGLPEVKGRDAVRLFLNRDRWGKYYKVYEFCFVFLSFLYMCDNLIHVQHGVDVWLTYVSNMLNMKNKQHTLNIHIETFLAHIQNWYNQSCFTYILLRMYMYIINKVVLYMLFTDICLITVEHMRL